MLNIIIDGNFKSYSAFNALLPVVRHGYTPRIHTCLQQ
jgi:hypothetical protein